MPKKADEWGPLDVKRAAHSGARERHEWHAVGGVSGLLLQVTAGGSKQWMLRTVVGAKRRTIGLGGYPEVSLAEARERAREAKRKIASGTDPVEERKAVKAALVAAQRRGLTVSDALDDWIKAKGAELGDEKTLTHLRSTFGRYVLPEIGKMLVHEVTTADVLRVLHPIWTAKTVTAKKVRQRLEAIFAWAAVAGHRPHDRPNAARWKHNLDQLLPKASAVATTTHQPAVAQAELPSWWAALSRRGGMGAIAVRFLALTATRSGEVRGARWDEIDTEAGVWTIPASRMKMGKEHRVALSKDALALLEGVPRSDDQPLVFWAPRGGQLSDMTLSKVMRDMQEEAERAAAKAGEPVEKAGWRDPRSGRPAVPHGLRSSFRDWAAEAGVEHHLAELCLAHDVGDAVVKAYRRADLLERRRVVMSGWADALQGRAATGNVVILSEARA